MPDFKKAKKVLESRSKYADDSLNAFSQDIQASTEKLLHDILIKYVTQFETMSGVILFNRHNLNLVNELDDIFEKYKTKYLNPIYEQYAKNLIYTGRYTRDYYTVMSFKEKAIKKADDVIKLLQESLGINQKGQIIAGSFIDRLALASPFQDQLKNYTLSNITGKISKSQFIDGYKTIITGDEDVSSKLLTYAETEAHDAYFNAMRLTDDYIADGLGLNFLMYLPGTIDTSREFCIEKVGRIFYREDVEKWRNEDWIGKKEPYEPTRDMGGWNCRHYPAWITDEVAKQQDEQYFNEMVEKFEFEPDI